MLSMLWAVGAAVLLGGTDDVVWGGQYTKGIIEINVNKEKNIFFEF